MTTFYERLEKLRKEKGISQGDLEKELGFSNGSISKWKKSTPTHDRLEKLAGYFGVTSKYLMTGEYPTETEKYYSNNETSEIAQEIFENKELRLLFDAAKDAQPDDLQTVHQILLALKRKERGDID